MNQPHEKIDSNVIRQGLLSIRNSQMELLNELKNETQQLKKTPMRFNTSTQDSRTDPQTKMDNIFSFPPENAESIVRYTPPSPSSVDKPFSFGLQNEGQLESEVARHKEENKALNETLQKLIFSKSLEKQRVRDLQSYLYFSNKALYQIIDQILNGTSIGEIKRAFENDLRINEDIYTKYEESNHKLVLELLKDKQMEYKPINVSNIPAPSKEPEMANQLQELKNQLVLLMKTNQKSEPIPVFGVENPKLKEQNTALSKKGEEHLIKIAQLESDNKELARCWQRQIHQRKNLIGELQKIKVNKANAEVDKQFSFMQSDMETQLNFLNEKLKEKEDKLRESDSRLKDYESKLREKDSRFREKEVAEDNNKERMRKLVDTVSMLRDQNEKLRKDVKSVEQLRTVIQQETLEASRSREGQIMNKVSQQGNMIQHFEQQNLELKRHLADMRRKFEVMAQMQTQQRETDMVNQQLQLRKVQAIKTNTTVEHLWQVKRVEYDNLNELLQELRDKNIRN